MIEIEKYPDLQFSYQGRILTVALNRPDLYNAINRELHHQLENLFRDLDQDRDSDVIILTGAGKSFSAGGDINWMQEMIDDPNEMIDLGEGARRIVFDLLALRKPVICRLNGLAIGLGATIALLCDIIVADDQAKISDPHVSAGLVAGDGGCIIWPQLMGFAKAKEFLLTGNAISAPDAAQAGLINYAVPAEQLDQKVNELADKLANGATQSIRLTKIAINSQLQEIAAKLFHVGSSFEMVSNYSADHQEAVNAFREKRAPVFGKTDQ